MSLPRHPAVAYLFLVRSMKSVVLILCAALLFGCATESGHGTIVGTWKMKERNSYLRLYADGKAVKWGDSSDTVAVWATFDRTTITFHDWDGNLIRRGPTLIVQSETGEDVYYRLSYDVEPPKT